MNTESQGVSLNEDRVLAEIALERYRLAKAAKQKAADDMKLAENELQGYATKHKDWFKETKTCNLMHGKLKWVASSSVEIDKKKLAEFAAAYPMAVKQTPSLSQVKKVLDVRPEVATVYGIEVKENSLKFAVEL